MRRKLLVWAGLLVACGGMLVASLGDSGDRDPLVTGLAGGSGSTVGPGGALYVTERAAAVSRGSIRERVPSRRMRAACRPPSSPRRRDGRRLPRRHRLCPRNSGRSRVGSDVVGIYRVDGLDDFTVIADIGTWSIDHPPATAFDVPSGSSTRWTRFATGSS